MKGLYSHLFAMLLILAMLVPGAMLTVPGYAHAFGGLTENGTAQFMGIGTANPQKILHVTGTGVGTVPLFQRATDSAGFIIERTPTNRWVFGVNDTSNIGFTIATFPTGSGSSVPRLMITQDGNVGIGTTSPSTKLHVQTSGGTGLYVSADGTGVYSSGYDGVYGQSNTGNGIGVKGFSLNGTGIWGHSPNNIGVYGGSDNSSSYAGYFEGNAAVTGNLTTSKVAYSPARTHYYSIPGVAFTPTSSTNVWAWYAGDDGVYMSSIGALAVPVNLPDGAVVTEFLVHFYDDTTTGNIDVYLYAQGFGEMAGVSPMADVSSSGSSGYQPLSDTTISMATINNATYGYFLYAIWGNPDGNRLRVRGARITYTISEAE